jgi:glycerophosphoryl diester phosphodiesterase
MLVLAHRGLHDDAPENSMAAFAAAVRAGADGIETDVRLSKDGVAVLVHDARVGRRAVAAMTHAEISRAAGHHVPSLDQALARFDVVWDVEIKSPDATDAVIASLRRHARRRRFFVTSFRRDVLARIAASRVAEFGLIVERAPLGLRRAPGTIVVWRFPVALRRRVRAAKARGAQVFAYGPRTPAEHARCVAAGVDGIITDTPALARVAPGRRP